MHYQVSGLHLQTNQPLAPLLPQEIGAPADVQIHLDETFPELDRLLATQQVWYSSAQVDEQGHPSLRISTLADGAYFRLAFVDGSEFVVDRDGAEVWGTWADALPPDERTSYLLDLVLSFVLCVRGVACLHASAISIGDRAVAFVGPEGVGKSTIATAFAMRGYPVVADDMLALTSSNRGFLAQPGYPWLRVRLSALSVLSHAGFSLPPLSPTENGFYFDLHLTQEGFKFERRTLPLAAIYFLSEPVNDVLETGIEPISASDALMTLVANTWAARVLNPPMRAREFETLSHLSAAVPLRRLRTGTTQLGSESLFEIISKDFRKIDSSLDNQHFEIRPPSLKKEVCG